MRKIHICFFISTAALVIALYLLEAFYARWTRNVVFEKPSWVLGMKNRKFDLAFLGSSRVFNMIASDSVEKKTGLSMLNIGSGGAALMENYLTLKYFIGNGNKISTLCLQIDEFSLNEMHKAFSYPFHEYLFFAHMQDEEFKEAVTINNGLLRYYYWSYVPFARYAEFSNVFSLRFLIRPLAANPNECSVPQLEKSRGSALLKDITMPKQLRKQCEQLQPGKLFIDSTSLLYLRKIIAFSEAHKIRLILYRAPVFDTYHLRTGAGIECEAYLRSLSEKYQLRFFSFQNLPVSTNPDKFKDYTHLNETGANIFSSSLADSLNLILKNN